MWSGYLCNSITAFIKSIQVAASFGIKINEQNKYLRIIISMKRKQLWIYILIMKQWNKAQKYFSLNHSTIHNNSYKSMINNTYCKKDISNLTQIESCEFTQCHFMMAWLAHNTCWTMLKLKFVEKSGVFWASLSSLNSANYFCFYASFFTYLKKKNASFRVFWNSSFLFAFYPYGL